MNVKKGLLLTFLLMGGVCHAADAVLQRIQGKVMIKPRGAAVTYPGRAGDPLYFGSEIKTEAGAMAHIQVKNGAALLVKENSSLILQGTARDTVVAFDVGEFLIGLKKKLAAGRSF